MSKAKTHGPLFRPPSPTTAPPQSQETNDDIDAVGVPLLEIVFSFNTAGAYGPMHPTSKTYLKGLIRSLHSSLLQKIVSLNSSSKTRIAIFAHGLHDKISGKKLGIQLVDFTDDVSVLHHFVATTSSLTWGARSHCYELVLRKARSLSWTPGSRRVLVLVGCTRPHYGNHPGTDELIHWSVEARCLARMGISVYTVEVKLQNSEHEFYRSVAEITEGCHLVLEQCTEMEDVITAIVSHLAGPEKLEELEQEVIDRTYDYYSTDMARLFNTLRHHDEIMTSLHDAPCLGTPQGSDFGDFGDDNSDDGIGNFCADGEASSMSKMMREDEESHGLKRRSSIRLKQNRTREQESRNEICGKKMMMNDFSSSSSMSRPRNNHKANGSNNEATGSHNEAAGITSLTRQQTVSFYLTDEEKSPQKLSKSSSSSSSSRVPDSSSSQNITTPRLRKSRTAPLPGKREERTKTSFQKSSPPEHEMNSEMAEHSRKRPALRKGLTMGKLDGSRLFGDGAFALNGGDASTTKVYKISREAPTKRENISPRMFTLRHLSWSPWKLVISSTLPSNGSQQWEPRGSDPRHQNGYRRKNILENTNDATTPALYEVALKTDGTTRKRVVFYKFVSELIHAETSWEDQILNRKDIQQEVSEAVVKKCSVFLRHATFAQRGGRAEKMVLAALHKYDYAWNDVQGFRRTVRRVEFV